MSANIAIIDGARAMAYQNRTPWHTFGERMKAIISVQQALEHARLDYQVEEQPLYLPDGQVLQKHKAIVRISKVDGSTTFLSAVGKAYQIMQHTSIFLTLQILCDRFGMTIEAAGALGNGERVWMLFKLPDVITPVDGDDVRGYILVTTGHDGTWALRHLLTGVRAICQNTITMAFSEGANLSTIYHTAGNMVKVDAAAEMVSRVVKDFQRSGETFAGFARRRLSKNEIVTFIERLLPTDATKPSPKIEERRRDVAELVFNGVGSDLARSTTNGDPNVWALYNAVTEYFDHVRTGQAKSAAGVKAANESAIFGSGAAIKAKAFSMARQLVAV